MVVPPVAGPRQGQVRCRAPLVSMEFDPFGDVQACCANTLFPLGNVARSSIDEIWHGPRAQLLRNAVAEGDFSLGCTVCRHRIDHGEAELPLEAYDFPLADGAESWPYQLSFALSNTCNLSCIMCGADRSSKIRSRRAAKPPLRDAYSEDFYRQLEPYLLNCERIDMVGGEPFLIRGHRRIWDILERTGARPLCGVTTNGTVWNADVERVLDLLDTDVRISIDGRSPRVFERVREGANHAEVYRNLERFRDYTRERGTELIVNWSFVQQNWFELGEMLWWAEERGIDVHVMTVIEPDFGVQRLADAELEVVAASLEAQSTWLVPNLLRNRQAWERQVEMIRREIERRSAGRPAVPYMEPPSPDHVRTIAAAVVDASLGPVDDGRIRGRVVADLLRWSLAETDPHPVGEVLVGIDGRIVTCAASSLLETDAGRASAACLEGARFEEFLDLLVRDHGGHLWLLEELRSEERIDHTLLIGEQVRDKVGVVYRCSSFHTGEGVTVLVSRDDRFAPPPSDGRGVTELRRGVPVSLRSSVQ